MEDDEILIAAHDGEVRLNIVSILKSLGWEDTPVNRDSMCWIFITELRRRAPTIGIVAAQHGGRQN